MKYIIRLMLIVTIIFTLIACSSPFIEVQVTQRVNTQDDPVIHNSELLGSERTRTSKASADLEVSQ